jgi:uncharacterized protein (TIGR00255 family)
VRSMTGFAEASAERGDLRIEVTVQGWNHRHLDVVCRLPEELRGREAALRERVGGAAARGRCELSVRLTRGGDRKMRARVEREALRALIEEAAALEREGLIEATPFAPGDLLRISQLVRWEPEPEAAVEGDLLDEVVTEALAAFGRSRRAEGERLGAGLERLRGELAALTDRIEARRREIAGRLEEELRRRLDEILPGGAAAVPAERLAQEIVLLAERGDVQEEIDRLRAHFEHAAEAMAEEGPVGKRLEFLSQEVLRELNTLGAKSRDALLTSMVVDGKVLCEQMREQIQNVE